MIGWSGKVRTLEVIHTSSRFTLPSLNTAVRASPISGWLPYIMAKSRCLKPVFRALDTIFPASPGSAFHVPVNIGTSILRTVEKQAAKAYSLQAPSQYNQQGLTEVRWDLVAGDYLSP